MHSHSSSLGPAHRLSDKANEPFLSKHGLSLILFYVPRWAAIPNPQELAQETYQSSLTWQWLLHHPTHFLFFMGWQSTSAALPCSGCANATEFEPTGCVCKWWAAHPPLLWGIFCAPFSPLWIDEDKHHDLKAFVLKTVEQQGIRSLEPQITAWRKAICHPESCIYKNKNWTLTTRLATYSLSLCVTEASFTLTNKPRLLFFFKISFPAPDSYNSKTFHLLYSGRSYFLIAQWGMCTSVFIYIIV